MTVQIQQVFEHPDLVELKITYNSKVVAIEFVEGGVIQLVMGMEPSLAIQLLTELREALQDLNSE